MTLPVLLEFLLVRRKQSIKEFVNKGKCRQIRCQYAVLYSVGSCKVKDLIVEFAGSTLCEIDTM